jgi:hypothetical protein
LSSRIFPIVVSLLLLGALTGFLVQQNLRAHQGQLIYGLDDPYIHLAIARNAVQHSVWGVTPEQFTFSSSSLLWPMLLGLGCKVFGFHSSIPFFLNCLIGLLIASFTAWIFSRAGVPTRHQIVLLPLTMLAMPLPALFFLGMEHPLHALLAVGFGYFFARLIESEEPPGWRETTFVGFWGCLLCLTRFEGLFFIYLALMLSFGRRRPGNGLVITVFSVIPMTFGGLYSLSQGWGFLPNPILLKANWKNVSSLDGFFDFFGMSCIRELGAIPQLGWCFAIAVALAILCLRRERFWNTGSVMIFLFLGSVILHLQLAKTGSFFRYEAYLIYFGMVSIVITIWQDFVQDFFSRQKFFESWIWRGVLYVFLLVVLYRAAYASSLTTPACTNIYEQQIQMARFFEAYYPQQAVAVNDIGAVSCFTSVRLTDLLGLADWPIAQAIRTGTYEKNRIGEIVSQRQVRVVAAYPNVLEKMGGPPPQWHKVAEWTISQNVVCYHITVQFFATTPAEAPLLLTRLRQFSTTLPATVQQTFFEE